MDKTFTGTLILNWKTNDIRVTKKPPKNNHPFEIPVQFEINVKIPEMPQIKATGEVEIPEHRVKDMVIESI